MTDAGVNSPISRAGDLRKLTGVSGTEYEITEPCSLWQRNKSMREQNMDQTVDEQTLVSWIYCFHAGFNWICRINIIKKHVKRRPFACPFVIWAMCLIGETSYQFWLIGLTHFWLNAGSTLINHSKNTGSWLRSKVMTSSAGRSLLSSDWLMMCHAAAPVSTMKSTYYLLRSLIIFISDTLSTRCHHYPWLHHENLSLLCQEWECLLMC